MNLQGLRTCIYTVNNLIEAKQWYEKVLGFAPYFDEPFYVGFEVQGFELGLMPEDENAIFPKSTNIYAYWGVEDIEMNFAKLIELGATAHELPTDVGDGILVATVKDPWNNVLGIIKNPFFKIK